jgi:hypothetical protein
MSGRKSLTLGLLAFDEKSTLDYFCFIHAYRVGLALYAQIKQKQSKVDFSSKAKSSNVRWVGIASELWVDCAARLIIIFSNMLHSLTHTQRDTAQKGASSASKSILSAVNIQVMAPTYHGKACGSHATLLVSSESGSINYFQVHSIQFGYLEPLNNQIFVPASSFMCMRAPSCALYILKVRYI